MNENFVETLYMFFFLLFELTLLFIAITFFVGLILQYVKPEKINNILTNSKKGVGNILGAALGSLTPFCSCSTIPVLMGLIKGGAPFGASMSFLIASPVLNPIIIGLLLGLFGLRMTILYAVITFTAAVLAGMIWEKMGLEKQLKEMPTLSQESAACQCNEKTSFIVDFNGKIVNAFWDAFRLFKSVMPFVVIGAAIGAIITGYLPQKLVVLLAGPENPLAIPFAAVLGVPMYIRAATMVPISAALLEKGMAIGPVVALIIGGAGASLPEVTLLSSIFKKKLLIAFLVTVFLIATMAGVLFTIASKFL